MAKQHCPFYAALFGTYRTHWEGCSFSDGILDLSFNRSLKNAMFKNSDQTTPRSSTNTEVKIIEEEELGLLEVEEKNNCMYLNCHKNFEFSPRSNKNPGTAFVLSRRKLNDMGKFLELTFYFQG